MKIQINTRCITPKRVTSLWGASPRHCVRATQLLSKKFYRGGESVNNTGSDLTDWRFESPTSRSTDKRVTARPTIKKINYRRKSTYYLQVFQRSVLGYGWGIDKKILRPLVGHFEGHKRQVHLPSLKSALLPIFC